MKKYHQICCVISMIGILFTLMVLNACDSESSSIEPAHILDSSMNMSVMTLMDQATLPSEIMDLTSPELMLVDQGVIDMTMQDFEAPRPNITPSVAYQVVPCLEYVEQDIDGIECAFLTMSQNRVRDTTREIKLFVVRPQSPPNRDVLPVVVLAGGPGAAHTSFAARKALPITMSQLLNREVIYYEQRGIAPSIPSTICPALDTATFPSVAFANCREELESEGVDIHSFHTIENAADIAEIPNILGFEKIDLIAGSYGTRLAAHVLSRHPESIRAAVLGGVDVPHANPDDSFPIFLEVLQQAATQYGQSCRTNEMCNTIHPNFDYATIMNQLQVLIERDGSVELFGVSVTHVDQIPELAFQMMYIAQIRNLFFGLLYHVADESLPSYLMYVGEGNAEAGADFIFQLITTAQQSVFGGSSVMSYITRCYDGDEGACQVIRDRIDDYPTMDFMQITGSEHPVLFLSGALDPATPVAHMELMTPLFPTHKHSIFECLGHDVSRISNLANGNCVVDQVRTFLDDPTADLPNCAPALCDALPLVPNQTQLIEQLSDYVENFDE